MLTLDRVPARTRSTPTSELPALPTTAAGRAEFFSNAVFAAVAALQKQLTDDDPAVVREVAEAILDLEKTRLRHGREVAGVECGPHTACAADSANRGCPPAGGPGTPAADAAGSPDPHTPCADHTPDESPAERAAREHREYLADLRRRMQELEDMKGSGKTVTPADAEAFFRRAEDRVRNGFDPRALSECARPLEPPRPGR